MWYVAAYVGGFASAFGVIIGVGSYAFRKPEIMAPLSRRMMRQMMKGGNK